MLQKMGWNKGSGLGKSRSGITDPIKVGFKTAIKPQHVVDVTVYENSSFYQCQKGHIVVLASKPYN